MAPPMSHSSQQAGQQQQPMGRSQSAFNFLLSKAKAPFSSSSSSSSLNTSTSLSSLPTHNEDLFPESHIQYHRQLQQFPHAPPLVINRASNIHIAASNPQRSSTSDSFSSRSSQIARPSISEDPSVSSPTKRSFFGGMGRDRKSSNASSVKPLPLVKTGIGHSPLGKGLRQDSAGNQTYTQFSKSQSDLHARPEFPSPTSATVDLPRMPSVLAPRVVDADRNRYLRSPSPVINYSRSVDDLASTEQQSASPFPSSPASHHTITDHLSSTPTASSFQGTWGEQGVAAGGDWRPSDMGTLASSTHPRDAQTRAKVGHGKVDSLTAHVPLSSAPSHQTNGWPSSSMPPPLAHHLNVASNHQKAEPAKHARKGSRFNSLSGTKDNSSAGASKGVVAGTLALSLGLGGIGGGSHSHSSSRNANEANAVPPGCVFQGFLSRNTNISLSFAQLNDTENSKGKEKDVSKGWKPYRVLLHDGKLFFYKPPSNVSDEVKALFPTTILKSVPELTVVTSKISPLSNPKEIAFDVNILAKSGLSKNELLQATSSNKDNVSPLASPSDPRRPKLPPPRPPTARTESGQTSSTVPAATKIDAASIVPTNARTHLSQAWAGPGKHAHLVLVETNQAPKRWVDRIQSGSIEALAHEYVNATQLVVATLEVGNQTVEFVFTILASLPPGNKRLATFFDQVHMFAQASLSPSPSQETKQAIVARLNKLVDTVIDATRVVHVHDKLETLLKLVSADKERIKILQEASSNTTQTAAAAEPIDWNKAENKRSKPPRNDLDKLFSARTIPDELLLQLEPIEVAQQIQAFHADRLNAIAASRITSLDLIGLFNAQEAKAFSFDSRSPHFITCLVLRHLLGDPAASQSDHSNWNQSGARHRASLLRHWIAIASYLQSLGDIVGWLAITAALCSRAVIRLEQTWRYLAEGDRVLVAREWAPILAKSSWVEGVAGIVQPRFTVDGRRPFVQIRDGSTITAIPFLGNSIINLIPVESDSEASAQISIATKAQDAVALLALMKQWRSAWNVDQANGKLPQISSASNHVPEYQTVLQACFESRQPFDYSAFMARSFQLEPKALGNLDAKDRLGPPRNVPTALSLVPLLFSEPLPHLSLLDASKVQDQVKKKDRRSRNGADPFGTITHRSFPRPAANGSASPATRSSAFSPSSLGSKNARSTAFGAVLDWSSASSGQEDPSATIKVGNELLLRVIQEPYVSLPSSPMTGKRFSQDLGRSPRPLSQVSKRSSLPASNRSSVTEIVVPVQVTVKAATLDRMIDVLVMGVQHITSRPVEEQIENSSGPPRRNKLKIDMESYRTIFLATFRSLCSAYELFTQLRKRFSAAVNASKEMAALDTYQTSSQFPSWIMVNHAGSHVEPTDSEIVYRIRMGVLLTLRVWIDRFPQDFADDETLFRAVHGFLQDPGMEPSPDESDYQKIQMAIGQINETYVSSIMSANARQEDKSYTVSAPVQLPLDSNQTDLDFDLARPEELVDLIESIATVFFDKIVERDLLVVSELFEKQAAHPTAWYAARRSSMPSGEEDKPVNSMYSLLDVLRQPSAGPQHPTLQQKLPAAVRDALAAQSLLRGWIAIHIIESGIGLQKRQARLEKLIDAVWICRARMLKLRSDETLSGGPIDGPTAFREATIGSFAESAILGSLSSSESRIFLRAWQGVATSRGGTGNDLSDLFPTDISTSMRTSASSTSTPDIGWILNCLAEASTKTSNTLDYGDIELLDFEKRRTIWSIIEGSTRMRPPCNSSQLVDLAGGRLKTMQLALSRVTWDRKTFRDDAAYEAAHAPPLPSASGLRLSSSSKALPALSKQQQEKHKRDRAALDTIEAMNVRPWISSRFSSMPALSDRASIQTSASTSSVVPPTTADKATVRARRMTALFRGAVRPLISEKHETPAKTVDELMKMTPIQKPSLVAGLAGAQVSVWNNSQRSFIFHLTSEEGAKYLLQAPTSNELTEWLSHIERISKERVPQRPAEIRKGGATKSKASVAPLYGIPLPAIIEREGGAIPIAIERMFAEIEARGLREQGIYRISGAKNAIEGLRATWSKLPPDAVNLSKGEFSDVHTIAGAIKQWFRELPEPAITFASYDAIIEAERIENHDDRLYAIRDIIWELPKCHFDLLRRTAEHLARVVEEGEHNLMAPHNIGLVFGTSLLNPPPGPSNMAQAFGNIGKAAHIVKIIVTMHEWLFEPEPEPEPVAEHVPVSPTTPVATLANLEPSTIIKDSVGKQASDLIQPPNDVQASTPHVQSMSAEGDDATNSTVAPNLGIQRSFSSDAEPLTPIDDEEIPRPTPHTESSVAILETPTTDNASSEASVDYGESVRGLEANWSAKLPPMITLTENDPSDEQTVDEDEEARQERQFGSVSPEPLTTPNIGTASALGQAIQRPKKARNGFRDSVFSSYSIYADCLENIHLESASASSILNKREDPRA